MEFRRLLVPFAAATLLAVAGCNSGSSAEPKAAWSPAPPSSPSLSPSAAAPSPSPSPSPTKSSPKPSPASAKPRTNLKYVFPVGGKPFSYARTHHDYPATDVIAPCGLPVRAVTDGVVLEVGRVDKYDPAANDGATRGGKYVSILGDDGVRYYGSHLSTVSSGINPRIRVRAGQQLGAVGETGDASACHLHFGISPPCARTGDWWVRRGVIWPYTYLDAWRAGTARSPASAVASWKAKNGCPSTAP
jgi:peptidoglycan LD-endopeptidase LytH